MRTIFTFILLAAFAGCGQDGDCSELQGTYRETNTITYSTCPDLLREGEVIVSVSSIGGAGGGSADPTVDCFLASGAGYDLGQCSLDADATCDHFDDQGFYLFTRRVETHVNLEPDGDYTGVAQITLSDPEVGQFCEAVINIDGELL